MPRCVSILTLVFVACASAPKEKMVYRNLINPSASYYQDENDCEKQAEAHHSLPAPNLAGSIAFGIQLAKERGNCMADRGWKLVPASSSAPSATSIPVSITSTPNGAEIYVDGAFIGSAPIELYRVEPGQHVLEAKKTGFQIWRRTITIQPGAPVTVRAELQAETSH
jgi:hypothetical protein